jgi:undecaprenyl-diphosphatase
VKTIGAGYEANTAAIIAGFLAAVIFGYLAIAFLLRIIVRKRSLLIFSVYCWVVGALTLIISFYYGII